MQDVEPSSNPTEAPCNNGTDYLYDDGNASSQQDASCNKKKKGVGFGEVRVRKHERILCERPSCAYAGLELGWAHKESERILVDDFEKRKSEEEQRNSTSRKPAGERLKVLSEYGYGTIEVLKLEREKKKAMALRKEAEKEAAKAAKANKRSKSPMIRRIFSGSKGSSNDEDDDDEEVEETPRTQLRSKSPMRRAFAGMGLGKRTA